MTDTNELEAARAMLAMIAAGVEHASDAFEITGPDGRIEYANGAHAALTGFPLFEVLGERLTRFVHATNDDDRALVAALDSAVIHAQPWRGEVRCLRKDGAVRHQELVLTPVLDGRGGLQRFVVVRRDITDRVVAEREASALRERVAQAERMSVVGVLASNFAHAVNNPMTFAMANIELARSELDELRALRPELREHLDGLREMLRDSLDGVDRIVQLVKDLRAFVRTEVHPQELVQLDDVVHDAVSIVRSRAAPRAALIVETSGPPLVFAARTRLGQVFVNVLLNAIEAIPAGRPDEHRIVVRTSHDEKDVIVVVEDSGRGIPHDHLEKIFDPFFTTKESAAGLGLPVARGIVEAKGGEIRVVSAVAAANVKSGTTLTVRLPFVRAS